MTVSPRRLFKHDLIQAEAFIVFMSDINNYRTVNIVHPSKNMSTYGTKFAFLLKDNNNKTCHRICTTFIVVFMHNIFINQPRECVSSFVFFERGALNQTEALIYFKSYLPPAPVQAEALIRTSTVYALLLERCNKIKL